MIRGDLLPMFAGVLSATVVSTIHIAAAVGPLASGIANGMTCFVCRKGFAGTPGYLSPEVLRKDPYGKPVDIWACGESSLSPVASLLAAL